MYLTLDEQEKYAYLSGYPIPEKLLDLAEIGENCPTNIGDIAAGFPEEDCLSGPIDALKLIVKYTHKNNKLLPDLQSILEALEEKQSELSRAAEYGMEEVKKLEKSLGIVHSF